MEPEIRFGRVTERGTQANEGSGVWSVGKTEDDDPCPEYRISLNPAMVSEPVVVVTPTDRLHVAATVTKLSAGEFKVALVDTKSDQRILCGFSFVATAKRIPPVEQV